MKSFRTWLSAAAICLALAGASLFAIEPGAKLPEIKVVKWLCSEDAAAQGEKEGPALSVVMLFDASAPDAANFLRLLEGLEAKYAGSGTLASVRAVAKNSSQELDSFVSAAGPFSVPVGAVDGAPAFKALAELETVLPYAIVADKSGVVMWSGHPTDIESVAARISDGSFSLESQRKMSAMRRELQFAIKAGLPEVVSNVADRMLAASPRDTIAVQAKLFAFESQGRERDAADFLAKACAANPKDAEMRLQLLALHLRQDDVEACNAAAAKYAEDFKSSPDALGRLAAFLLDNSPFGSLQQGLALASAQAAVDGLKSGASAERRAGACEILAKAFYYAGAVDRSVLWQSKACELRKGGRFEAPARRMLEYYESAVRLRSSLPPLPSEAK